ncbi:Beta-site APP-cleaving enzyme [Linnemannia zychae]|nr:Beta-site APP-cleaving enzyme [Linnemannia zychae]
MFSYPVFAVQRLVAAVAALGGSGSNSPTGALSGDQAPLNLLKGPVNKDREADSGSMTTSAATTTTTVTATASRSISSAVSEKSSTAISSVFVSSSPSLSAALSLSTLTSSHSAVSTEASSATATTHTPVTTSTSVAQRPSDLPVYPAGAAQDAFHVGANARFSDNLERLKKLQAEMASAAASEIQPIVPARHQSGDDGTHQRALVVAPEVHLYPLSANARNQGESIRVSYGIKTHSVGWSGVMTSDLMAIDMAKVKSGNSTTVSATAAKTTDAPGSVHLEDGGIMEKETNVGFAAITENTGFFSQECGAQHGIWGLGYRSLSVDRKPTLFDTLSASMKIPNGFALQLCGRVGNTTKSGNMFLGGYSTSHIAEPMQFVPLVKRDWYQVQLDGFKVMGKPVQGMANLNLPKTIVDSGTTNILMSHYNLQFLIDALSRSEVVQWSSLIPEQDINNFWFRNAVLRLPRSSFKVETRARAVEVVMSGVAVPIYTASFLRIKPVPAGQAPEGYVDFWWHGFASSTAPDSIEAERASGGAVMPGSVGTILGETLFSGKLVFFERGNEQTAQEAGDEDFGRIGFARGKNCFAPADHRNVDVLASQGQVAVVDLGGLGPVRVAATSDASGIRLGGGGGGGLDVHAAGAGGRSGGIDKGVGGKAQPKEGSSTEEEGMSIPIHISALDTHIRLMGGATGIPRPWSTSSNSLGLLRGTAAGIFVAYLAAAL